MTTKKTVKTCRRGHEMDDANTGSGHRCLACRRLKQKERYLDPDFAHRRAAVTAKWRVANPEKVRINARKSAAVAKAKRDAAKGAR